MLAREGRLARPGPHRVPGLSIATVVQERCCHYGKHQNPDGSRDDTTSTVAILSVRLRTSGFSTHGCFVP